MGKKWGWGWTTEGSRGNCGCVKARGVGVGVGALAASANQLSHGGAAPAMITASGGRRGGWGKRNVWSPGWMAFR